MLLAGLFFWYLVRFFGFCFSIIESMLCVLVFIIVIFVFGINFCVSSEKLVSVMFWEEMKFYVFMVEFSKGLFFIYVLV